MDKRKDPWGTSLDIVGFYNPRAKPKVIRFDAERINYWLSKGAEASATVWNLLVDQKIVEGAKRRAHPTGAKKAADAKAAAPAAT